MNDPRVACLIPAGLYLLFILMQLMNHGFDLSYFIQAGDQFVNPAQSPKNLMVLPNSSGYDGQFYYRLALTPFTNERTAAGVTLDIPPYRQQRIVYPVLAWLLSLGRPPLVPFALLFVNYGSVCLMGWLGGKYAQLVNRHALWGITFPLYAGFVLVVARDLAEIVELCLVLAVIVCFHFHQHRRVILLLTLAVLTKETALLLALAMLLPARGERWYAVLRPRLQWLPVLVYGVWQGWLRYRWGISLRSAIQNNIGVPLVGFLGFFRDVAVLSNHWQRVWFIEICLLLIFTVAVAATWCMSRSLALEKRAWIFYCVLVFMLTRAVWVEDWAFLRACSEFYLLGIMILLNAPAWWRDVVLVGGIVCWVLLVSDVLIMR